SLRTIRVNESARTRLSRAGEVSNASASCLPTLSPSNAKVWTSTECCAARRSSRSLGQNSLKSTRSSIFMRSTSQQLRSERSRAPIVCDLIVQSRVFVAIVVENVHELEESLSELRSSVQN